MRIIAQASAGGEPVSEGTKVFVLQELRGPTARAYTTEAGEEVSIEQSFRVGAVVREGPERGRMGWDTFDVDGPMGWRFTALANACLGKRHEKGDAIDTDAMLGKAFVATIKHSPSKTGGVFTNFQNVKAVEAAAPPQAKQPKASLAKAAKRR